MNVFMQKATMPGVTSEPEGDETVAHAWKPEKSGAMARVLRTMSGWHGIAVPFMMHNIGWFVSGFLLVAGSVFVVASTKGFAGNLVTAIFLFCYALLLIAGAWHMKRRRPELQTVARVLVTVAALLMPLSIAGAARMIDMQSIPALIAGILLSGVNLLIFFPAGRLASGIIDRDLQGLPPKLFISLAAIQLAAPVVGHFSGWPVLAAAHAALLGLSAYGFRHFLKGGLRSVFLENRAVAYYTAGLVLYAAAVSFVHLTWRFDGPLPDGYFGPFLMLLSGLLFRVDAKIKQWTTRNVILTCSGFAVYGLSVAAMAVCFDAPVARPVTLVLGAGVYANVMRRYLTPAPMYMFLGCLGWLYGSLILRHVPWDAYLLASVPGLSGLFAIHQWIIKRNAGKLAAICFRILTVLFIGLAIWSLIHAGPGLAGCATCLLVAGAVWHFLRYSFPLVFSGFGLSQAAVLKITGGETDLRNTSWFYSFPLALIAVLAYAPVFTGAGGLMQFAGGLAVLAAVWGWNGTAHFRKPGGESVSWTSVLFNSALLFALSALVVAAVARPALNATSLHLVLVLSGCVIGWLGLAFRMRALVCFAIVLAGVAMKLIRRTWFPGIPMGVSSMLAACAAWAALWLISGKMISESNRLGRLFALLPKIPSPDFKLMWLSRAKTRSVAETVHPPLELAIPLFWLWAMYRLGNHAAVYGPTPGWTLGVAFGAAATGLFAVSFRMANLSPIPLVLTLGAWLGLFYNLGIRDLGSLCLTTILWSMSVLPAFIRAQSGTFAQRLASILKIRDGASGNTALAERRTRDTTDAVAIIAMIAAVGDWCFTRSPAALFVLPAGMIFFGLAGRYYKSILHSYVVLAAASVSGLMAFAHVAGLSNAEILLSNRTGLFFAVSGLLAWALAQMADRFGEEGTTNFHKSLYRKPLRIAAVGLSLFGAATLLSAVFSGPVLADAFVLSVAATGLLLGNHRLKNRILATLGISQAAVSVLWIEGSLVHGGFWPLHGDQWLAFALTGFILACFATQAEKSANRLWYATPLKGVSLAIWTGCLLKTVPALVSAMYGNTVEYCVPFLFAVQTLALFPLSQTFKRPSEVRGIGVPLLLTGFVLTILPAAGVSDWTPYVQIGWAFALVGLSDFALPAFNSRSPEWNLETKIWPWLGLILAAMRFPLAELKTVPLQWHYWAGLAVYLGLMLRTATDRAVYWLTAGALSCAAVLSMAKLCAILHIHGANEIITGALVWTAFLPFLIPVARKYGAILAEKKGWKRFDPEVPFLASGAWLLFVSLVLGMVLPGNSIALPMPSLALGAALLSLCFFHLLRLRDNLFYANGLILSVLFGTATAWLFASASPSHIPFAMSVFCGTLFGAGVLWERKPWGRKSVTALVRALDTWTMLLPWPALLALLAVPMASLLETLAALAILAVIVGTLGFRKGSGGLIFASRILGLILLHVWPFSFLPPGKTEGLVLWRIWPVLCAQFERLQMLFPWYALQLAILAWIVIGVREFSKAKPHPATKMFGNLSLEITLAFAAWAMHFIAFVQKIGSVSETAIWIQGIGAIFSAMLLAGWGIRKAIRVKKSTWVYGTAIFTGLALTYLRLAVLGLARPGIWDAAVIVAVACGLSVAHRFAKDAYLSVPLYRMALLLPVLAVFMPLQFSSPAAAALLLATGAHWLSMRHATGKSLPLYLGVLAINGAIYLWVPAWAGRYDLLQLYAVPAALTMLVLLHLHRKEIKRGVLNNTRLAAICMLYVSAGLDVFLRPEFWIFGLAFALALTGVALGIAFRIRAFLFGGVVFLVMNVLGQMIRFYPEQGLDKGILLMASGAATMSGMIWFNVKKESILRRVRIFRSDLENWE